MQISRLLPFGAVGVWHDMTFAYAANTNTTLGARIDSNDQAMYDLLPQPAAGHTALLLPCPSGLTLKDM